MVLVDGEVRSSGRYPTCQELADWTTSDDERSVLDPATTELVALGAAIGANREPCFKFHYDQSRRLGFLPARRPARVVSAVHVAQRVKDAPGHSMVDLAARLLWMTPAESRGRPRWQLGPGGPGGSPTAVGISVPGPI